MSFLFGGASQTKKDLVREYQKDLRHSVRGMDREELKIASQEKILVASINKLAKERRFDLCKAKAKELIRLRAHRSRVVTMKGYMSTLQYQLSSLQSAKVMQETMAKTTHLLCSLNTHVDANAIHSMLLEFERQSLAFGNKQEVLEETLDGIFEADNEQESTDQALANVFQELGLEIEMGLGSSGTNQSVCHTIPVSELEARLQSLTASQKVHA